MSKLTRREALDQLVAEADDSERLFEKPLTQWRLALRRFRGRKSGMVGLTLIVGLATGSSTVASESTIEVIVAIGGVGSITIWL